MVWLIVILCCTFLYYILFTNFLITIHCTMFEYKQTVDFLFIVSFCCCCYSSTLAWVSLYMSMCVSVAHCMCSRGTMAEKQKNHEMKHSQSHSLRRRGRRRQPKSDRRIRRRRWWRATKQVNMCVQCTRYTYGAQLNTCTHNVCSHRSAVSTSVMCAVCVLCVVLYTKIHLFSIFILSRPSTDWLTHTGVT